MLIVTAGEMQAIDRQTIETYGIPGQVLMENAGRGATRSFLERVYKGGPGSVGILAGRGNNGGDGFVMARYLAQRGIDTRVFLLANADRTTGDAAANLKLLSELGVPVIQLPDHGLFEKQQSVMRHMHFWIDAVLGTGLNSDVKGYFKQALHFLNEQKKPVFAVDIPSGLNADTGRPCGIAVRATATATFAFPKIGHLVYPGAGYCGQIDVIDIGIPPFITDRVAPAQSLITPKTVVETLGIRQPDAHKGRTGHVLVVAGSPGKTGAAAMASAAALRAGAGLVSLGIAATLNPILEALLPEVMTLPLNDNQSGILAGAAYDDIFRASQNKSCLAIGPGMGTSRGTRDLVHRMIREIDLPLVIDADGLNHLAENLQCLEGRSRPVVVTPHPGEMARLTGLSVSRIQADRVAAARDLARKRNLYVVLKGARTVVAAPDGHAWINPTGNPGMASGGMGDVLTGLVAGFLAQGRTTLSAALCGVYLHGLAADLLAAKTPWGYLATDVMNNIPEAIREVLQTPPKPPCDCPIL